MRWYFYGRVAGNADSVWSIYANLGNELGPALEEETRLMRSALDWDLRPATDLVRASSICRRSTGSRFSKGLGRSDTPTTFGMPEGLIGDLYVMARERTPEREHALMEATLEALWRFPACIGWSRAAPVWFKQFRSSVPAPRGIPL